MTGLLRNLILAANAAGLVVIAAGVIGRDRYRKPWLGVMRGLRVRHFAAALPLLFLILVVSQVLEAVPPLRFSWWELIGGTGNPGLGTTQNGATLITVATVTLVLLLVPLLAWFEEGWFRDGACCWRPLEFIWRCLWFGLFHAFVGVSLSVALALSLGGVFFAVIYRRAYRRHDRLWGTGQPGVASKYAQLAAARFHAAYNYIVVTLLVIWLLASS